MIWPFLRVALVDCSWLVQPIDSKEHSSLPVPFFLKVLNCLTFEF